MNLNLLSEESITRMSSFYPSHWTREEIGAELLKFLKNFDGIARMERAKIIMDGIIKDGIFIRVIYDEGKKEILDHYPSGINFGE